MTDQPNYTEPRATSDGPFPTDFRSGTPQPSTVPEPSGPDRVEPGMDPMAPQRPQEGQTYQGVPQAPSESEVSPEAKLQRLQQSLAQKNKLLSAIGIDPASDLAEQYESGLITEEMVSRHIAGQRGQTTPDIPQQTRNDPLSVAQQRYEQAKQAYDAQVQSGEGVDFQVNKELVDAQSNYFDAKLDTVTQQVTARDRQRQVSENVNSVLNVAKSDPNYSNFDEQSRKTYEQVLVNLTGSLVDQEAARMGMSPMEFSPQQFAHFAQRAAQELAPLANQYVEMGRRQAQQSLVPRHPQYNNTPSPAHAGGPNVPVSNPFAKTDYRNHNDMARQYLANTGRVI
jgi:hypothetical protein